MNNRILIFLGIFLSVVFFIYCLVPKKIRYLVLLFFSYLFLFFFSSYAIIFVLISSICVYFIGLKLNQIDDNFQTIKKNCEKEQRKQIKEKCNKKKKNFIFLGISINFGILILLKYFNFLGNNISSILSLFHISFHFPLLKLLLPLGLSYYTLQAVSYIVDVYRGKFRAEKNFAKIALFLGYFPKMIEGPIDAYDKLSPTLFSGEGFHYLSFTHGLQNIAWGLFKKVVIADRINIIVAEVFKNYPSYSGGIILLAVVLFTIQIYAEFSGVIDMVSGISEMFNIQLGKNFAQPFFSKTVSEFWRRWHISLGAWIREYIFYPISLSKFSMSISKKLKGKVHPFIEKNLPIMIAMLFVWLFTGLWHGASMQYIFYGLYYYLLIVLGVFLEPLSNKIIKNKNKKSYQIFQMMRTFILVNIGMFLFRCRDISTFFSMFSQMFQRNGIHNIFTAQVIDIYDFTIIIIGIFILFFADLLKNKKIEIRNFIDTKPIYIRWPLYISLVLVIVVFGAYGPGYLPVDPIYAQF